MVQCAVHLLPLQATNARAVVPYARDRTYTTAELHLFPVGALADVPRKVRRASRRALCSAVAISLAWRAA